MNIYIWFFLITWIIKISYIYKNYRLIDASYFDCTPFVSSIFPGMAMIPGMAAAPMVQPSIGPVALKLESPHVTEN